MGEKLISVIMPVYNAIESLKRAVESIIAQTYTNWELILIDDGSTDQSAALCDDYCVKDSRISVVHKKNSGVAAARQSGLEKAHGEYIIHADADDWVEENYLYSLYNVAISTGADVVACDYYYECGDRHLYISQPTGTHSGSHYFRNLVIKGLHAALWNKLIKKSIINQYDARFFEGYNYCEDTLFLAQILPHEGVHVEYCASALYHYDNFINENSITRKYNSETWSLRTKYLKLLSQFLCNDLYAVELSVINLQLCREGYVRNFLTWTDAKQIILKNYKYIYLLRGSRKKILGMYLLPFSEFMGKILLRYEA